MAFVVFFGTISISLSPNATAGVHNNLESAVFFGGNALFVSLSQTDTDRAECSACAAVIIS